MMGILISPLLVVCSIGAFVSSQPLLLAAAIVLWAIALYIVADFLWYGIKQKGTTFAMLSFFMYFVEGLTAFIGLLWGVFRYLILQRKDLDFRYGGGI
jgi:hypothetical protein